MMKETEVCGMEDGEGPRRLVYSVSPFCLSRLRDEEQSGCKVGPLCPQGLGLAGNLNIEAFASRA